MTRLVPLGSKSALPAIEFGAFEVSTYEPDGPAFTTGALAAGAGEGVRAGPGVGDAAAGGLGEAGLTGGTAVGTAVAGGVAGITGGALPMTPGVGLG